MRPRIISCKAVRKTLRYNELKIMDSKAECLLAGNFMKDASQLSFEEKAARFNRLKELNDRIKVTNLHISLNFDPSERLSDERMAKIARMYMKEIGFGSQPYLVYRHHDAGHPHLHIVTTHIRPDGSPITLYNIGRNQSEKARLHIEGRFQLVSGESKRRERMERRLSGEQDNRIGRSQKVQYGKEPTSRAISEVLDMVLANYKFTSLGELNAVLRLYRIEGMPVVREGQKHRGLLYRVLDAEGRSIGVPLKASFFDSKATLANLEKKFSLNQVLRKGFREHIATAISLELRQKPDGLTDLSDHLRKRQITMAVQRDKEGKVNEVMFVDFGSKSVFDAKELGAKCSLRVFQELADKDFKKELRMDLEQEQKLSRGLSLGL